MKKILTLTTIILLSLVIKAQPPKFPCNGDFRFTRQSGTSTFVSKVDFIPGDINIINPGTISPAALTNASVQYGGYIWTQDWGVTTGFTLLRVAADYTTTAFPVATIPAGTTFNNAGVDKNGKMYILTNANPVSLYTIDLATGTPTYVSTKAVTFPGLVAAESVIWGDISTDPVDGKVYCWYHPTATVTPLKGLYEITGITGATPTLVKRGVDQQYTLGSLFFNDRGQLFGYGAILGANQDKIFAVDKQTGIVTQYGLPDIQVSQSDGCECSFRISLERKVSTPVINVPKCGVDTFNYTFTVRNFSNGTATPIIFSDTLDSRLSYAFNIATLQTQLQAIYGAATTVTLTNYAGGVNNLVTVTGMAVALGATTFTLPVKVDANKFTASASIAQQAYLKGIDVVIGGPNEPSDNPTTFNAKDRTGITINLSGSKCLPPLANNFINAPMPQGNGATAIPGLLASDPDGTIASYTIATFPPAAQGVLSYCSNGTAPCTGTVINISSNNVVLTPAQMATLKFDPAPNFAGNASFTFAATDNSGNLSNLATYTLPITALPPVSNNIMENSMVNTNGPTPIQPLNSSDADGTITSYQITTVPPVGEGVLSYCNGGTGVACTGGSFVNITGATTLTPAQMASLRFDPTAGFVGNATFNYNALDNSGNTSNTANYTIPVTGTATNARPPLAENITAQPLNNSLGNTAIPKLLATDLDGFVSSYKILTIPAPATGVLRLSCPSTPTGLTCVGGYADILANTVLTPAESARLFFDPAPGYVGTANFTFNATDNAGLVSNTATYNLPIVNTPPTAVNINTTFPFNGAAAPIVPLSGNDIDGTVTTFTLTSLPTAAQGTLSVPCPPNITGASACTGGFQNLTAATLTANGGAIALTPAQALAIKFAPTTGFSGPLSFNYTTTDNNSLVSTPAVYNITIANQPPVANDVTVAVMPNTNGVTALVPSLSATDPDGTIANYTILTLPPATSGSLSIPCPATPAGATCTGGFAILDAAVLAANPGGIVLTATQAAGLNFDPAANYTGVVNFTYSATDNSGNISNIANYNIPISGVGNLPPVAQNIQATPMPNTNGQTPIPNLIGSDPDGTVANYTITTIPPASQGVLYYNNGTGVVPLTAGTVLTPAQISTLTFDPTAGFTGNAVFSYYVTDNVGLISNEATYTIPVTGTPPVSTPILAPAMPQSNGPTTIPGLISTDADGTIASYFIEKLPPTSQGVLSIPCPPTLIGATCLTTGPNAGYQILTDAILANYPNGGIPVTPTQMAAMKFDPAGTYSGNVVFNYHATDNSGLLSNSTTYTIPVTGLPPISTNVTQTMLNSNGPTLIAGLASTDPEGLPIAYYVLNSLPNSNQGVLSVPCPPTPNGATCNGSGFADLTAAVLAANPGGIVLTPAQAAGLNFDPLPTFNGDVIFNFSAFDNNGNMSNIATYTIPTGTAAVLPLSNLQFTGQRIGNNIALNWKTENESALNKYEIEYSTTTNGFVNAGSKAALNASNNNYQFILNNFKEPIYFIRLKVIGVDGRFTYSNIIIVRLNGRNEISIYPTPAESYVNIEFGNNSKGKYTMQILDAAGKNVKSLTVENVQSNQTFTINRDQIATGIYYVIIKSNTTSEVITKKIIFK